MGSSVCERMLQDFRRLRFGHSPTKLDGRIERVHVDVHNFANAHLATMVFPSYKSRHGGASLYGHNRSPQEGELNVPPGAGSSVGVGFSAKLAKNELIRSPADICVGAISASTDLAHSIMSVIGNH